jgi:hypothetical protein
MVLRLILYNWFSVNGEREYLSCHEFSRDEVHKWLSYMCTRSGIPVMRFRKYQHTDYPSIQGVWNPFTHQAPEINLAQYPHVKNFITFKLQEIFVNSNEIYFRTFYLSLLTKDQQQLSN